MHNDILTIGKLTVHGYGLMIAIGILAAVAVAMLRAKKREMDQEPILDIVLIAMIGGFLGSKILYIIVEWKSFIKDPIKFLGGGGFVVYGGIILGLTVAFLYFKWKKLDFFAYMDLCMPSVSIAQGIGRIGCFLAGCCYGAPTDSALGVVFPSGSLAPAGVKLWPTQLFMSVGNLIIAGILMLASQKLKKKGQIAALYMILYSAGRFGIEFFRADSRGNVGALSTSQFISIFIFIIGAALLYFVSTKKGEEVVAAFEGAVTGTGKSTGGKDTTKTSEKKDGKNNKTKTEKEKSDRVDKKKEEKEPEKAEEDKADATAEEEIAEAAEDKAEEGES